MPEKEGSHIELEHLGERRELRSSREPREREIGKQVFVRFTADRLPRTGVHRTAEYQHCSLQTAEDIGDFRFRRELIWLAPEVAPVRYELDQEIKEITMLGEQATWPDYS